MLTRTFPSGFRFLPFARWSLALTAVLGASLAIQAQAPAAPARSAEPTLNLSIPPAQTTAQEPSFSSSVPADEIASLSDSLKLTPALNAMQYGGRRSGRPRYRGEGKNPDGSDKYEFYAGAGFVQPVGNTYHYYSPNWGMQVGGGRNFSRNVGVNLEFDWDALNLNGRTFQQQAYVYDPTGAQGIQGTGVLDAYAKVWSLSLQPVYNIAVNEGLGAYITAGVGFYHKTTTFTLPASGCDPYYYYYYGVCYQVTANAPFDSYTSNAPGVDAGIGFTYKFSRFSNERFYAEARYVFVANQARAGVTYQNALSAPSTATNFFPANSHRTTYLPFKFGIRF